MEQINLTIPEIKPTIQTNFYRVIFVSFDWRLKSIVILLEGTNAEVKSFTYEDTEATNLMIALNKANLSVQSLHRRILARLITDGKIQGSVSGVPD